MHPAKSLIYFTSASGLGFGLLVMLGLGVATPTGWNAFWFYALGYGLAVSGLCASLLHLGNPQRAWRALSQWRSSWLSREGVLAVLTLLAFAPGAIGQVFFATPVPLVWGFVAAVLALLTVFSTAMIYAQLKTVPRWHTLLVPLQFLAFAITGGALLVGFTAASLMGLLFLALVLPLYWLWGSAAFANSGSDMQTATGLNLGTVRLLEAPHTSGNYLTKEMVFRVARRHAQVLQVMAWVLLAAIPVLIVLAWQTPVAFGLATISFICGMLVSRWLFFAQAEHVVGLYYGKSA